jgi:DNA-binding response OmpR family regulator
MDLVLAVDDEQNIADLISMWLKDEGFRVETAGTGREAIDKFHELKPSLIILDIMLPDIDGWEVCRTIRKESNVPIIMLTAKDMETDTVVGLELGADDYVTKPFNPRELVARVKAVLRRSGTETTTQDGGIIDFEDIVIDIGTREVKVDGKDVMLTAKEFDLLKQLAANPRIVFSREQLLERIWGYDFFGGPRTVDVHIRHLREKLGEDPSEPRFIETIRSAGYRFKGR